MSVRLTDEEAWSRIEHAHTGILTTLRKDGSPATVPVWFVNLGRSIYIRTPSKSAKVGHVRRDERATFLIESGENWQDLSAVIVHGRATIVGDETERQAAETALAEKYAAYRPDSSRLPDASRRHYGSGSTVIRIDPAEDLITWDNRRIRMQRGASARGQDSAPASAAAGLAAAPAGEAPVLVSRDGRVATVILNRPDKLNALTPPMRVLLMETLAGLDADPAVGCVILTGQGRGFCAGADTSVLQDLTGAQTQERFDHESIRTDFPLRMSKPLIAAVNGPVAGVGFAYALMADIRIAAAGARWAASFAALGLVAEQGLSWLLPRAVGTGAALEIMLSAEPITSEDAHRIGLAQHVLPAEEVLPAARRLAATIASRSPYSLRAIKEQVRLDAARSFEEAFLDMRRRVVESLDGPDFAEAMAARRAGRQPDYKKRRDEHL
jgi:PPOX class probable F420-dependent enzyme